MSRNLYLFLVRIPRRVAPREGRVSRNLHRQEYCHHLIVAPREGRVSRNVMAVKLGIRVFVAPREGRVSRNHVQT